MADLNSWGDLERYIPFLRCRTQTLGLDPQMQVKLDPDDVVQEVMLRAWKSPAEPAVEARFSWLESILASVFCDMWRALHADKRDADREVQFLQKLTHSTAGWDLNFAASQPSPSGCAMLNENQFLVTAAVERLPGREREVAILHFFVGLTLAATAKELGLTTGQVGNLYRNVGAFLRADLEGIVESRS